MMASVTPVGGGTVRCDWSGTKPDYIAYHDVEWGFPQDNDILLFEKLCLEGFQSGLSWYTILRRRESFRRAFYGFDYRRVALMGSSDVARLLLNKDIVRHRGKIESVINNSRRALTLEDDLGSFGAFFWSFEPSSEDWSANTQTPESIAMAKALKARGFSFIGPTTAFAFMEATGIVNNHKPECFVRSTVEAARGNFVRPVVS